MLHEHKGKAKKAGEQFIPAISGKVNSPSHLLPGVSHAIADRMGIGVCACVFVYVYVCNVKHGARCISVVVGERIL